MSILYTVIQVRGVKTKVRVSARNRVILTSFPSSMPMLGFPLLAWQQHYPLRRGHVAQKGEVKRKE